MLYVGDLDPSGMFMSQEDLPARLAAYDGDHVTLKRIALTWSRVIGLPSFPVTDKRKDPRFQWFCANHGDRCWELDAMDPDLRDCVEESVQALIEPLAWERCEVVNRGGTGIAEDGPRWMEGVAMTERTAITLVMAWP